MGGLMTPLLKKKVDELFLHWFSEAETQKQLKKDLASILGGAAITEDHERPTSPTGLSLIGLNTNNRPSSPPIPPSSPTTPRSPRVKKQQNRRGSRKSFRQSVLEEKRGQIFPGCAKNIKAFYFPFGEPINNDNAVKPLAETIENIKNVFTKLPNGLAKLSDFRQLAKACNYPLYWKYPFYSACRPSKSGEVSCQQVINTYKRISSTYHDEASQFFYMLVRDKKTFLETEDFEGLLQDIINTHPGLQFLLDAPEFHSRYIITVISRIFYTINRKWDMRLTLPELRKSSFMAALHRLEEEEDINQVTDFFSYEHFYVIYCKFWELDTDHDMVISKEDISTYANGAISSVMLTRLFSGCVTRASSYAENKMSYVDFVWFILSEVDKSTHTSIEYWFRCMDLNGDGVLSLYELECFYNEQLHKMEELGMEKLSFNDAVCQTLDLVKPEIPNMVTLRDIKRCKLAPVFFDTFFNLDKWLEHEQKDPFQASRDENEGETSIWERYVNIEYELLVAEEGGTQEIEYDEDFDEDMLIEDRLKPLEQTYDDTGPKWSVAAAVSGGGDTFNPNDETFY